METILFALAALVAVAFALVVVLHPDPIRSVLALVVAFFAIAVIYVQLAAPLMAVLQIVVYAGAILVLFLFVVMLLNVGRESRPPHDKGIRTAAGAITAGGLGAMIVARILSSPGTGPQGGMTPEVLAAEGSVRSVALVLFQRHLFAFELVSVVLLAALVGALVLARKGNE
jgi:NADH-quinone oxidoreductase subunit J